MSLSKILAAEGLKIPLTVRKMIWDQYAVSSWQQRGGVWQDDRVLERAGFHKPYQTPFKVTKPANSKRVAIREAEKILQDFKDRDPWGNMGDLNGVIEWVGGGGEGTFSAVYSTYHSST